MRDSLFQAIVFVIFIAVGLVAILIGRTMDNAEEQRWKEGWREWISGPPGIYRASTLLFGFVMVAVGIVGFAVGCVRVLME